MGLRDAADYGRSALLGGHGRRPGRQPHVRLGLEVEAALLRPLAEASHRVDPVKSRSSYEVYFWDLHRQRPQKEFPLPPGSKQCVSKSSGKVYYFNASRQESMYTVPTE